MQVLISQRITTTPGPNLTIDCPACASAGVVGETASVEEANKLFFVIPFFTSRWVTIRCASCRKQFPSKQTPEALARMPAGEVSKMLLEWKETGVSFLVKFCVVISLVFGIVPVAGLACGVVGVLGTFRSKSPWKGRAIVGLALGAASTGALIAFSRH